MHKTVLFDQLTPVALYGKIKALFPNEVTMLFESVLNTSDGNFSFITIGAQERLSYKNKTTTYTNTKSRNRYRTGINYRYVYATAYSGTCSN